ncbi:hypothetical protein B7486_15990 [cyanobacterium TDX16]|nr:hypothetical protein B7486_15990 [cyanobacterium TDX16]
MNRKYPICIAMVFLVQGSCAPVAENGDLEKAPEASRYYVDVVAISLVETRLPSPHFIRLERGDSKELLHWFHCGPVSLKRSEFEQANSYFEPHRTDEIVSANKKIDPLLDLERNGGDWEYSGRLAYQVLTEGFPVKLQVTYTYRDLRHEKDIAKIEGVAEFTRNNHQVIMRSEDGNYLLLLQIREQN